MNLKFNLPNYILPSFLNISKIDFIEILWTTYKSILLIFKNGGSII